MMTKLIAYTTTTLAFAGALLAAPNLSAQERCKMSWETPAADTNYTQQLSLDVGDIPGHQVRVFELHRVYRNDKPNCEGLKRTEGWTRGYSDYIDRNGRAWGYSVDTLQNGDKIYMEWTGSSQTTVTQDGSKEGHFEGTVRWTGGTGKYVGVRGLERDHTTFNLDKSLNEEKAEAEYWFEK
ncbi:MAG: hypothetical protein JO110_08960 [Acetobacteraceae bacterium]|nr:hypothetical protein [Acetobacteraceae bacterium]